MSLPSNLPIPLKPPTIPIPSVPVPTKVHAPIPSVPVPTKVPVNVPMPVPNVPLSVPVPTKLPAPVPSVPLSVPVPTKVPAPVPSVPASIPVPTKIPAPVPSVPVSVPVPTKVPAPVPSVPLSVPVPTKVPAPVPASIPVPVSISALVPPKVPSPVTSISVPTKLPAPVPNVPVPSVPVPTKLPAPVPNVPVPSVSVPPKLPAPVPSVPVPPKLPALVPSVPVPNIPISSPLPPPTSLPKMPVAARKEAVLEKIEEEIQMKETIIEQKKPVLLGVPTLAPLKPLDSAPIFSVGKESRKPVPLPPSAPVLPSLPPLPSKISPQVSPIKESAIAVAKEGVKTALLTEPEATFQPQTQASPLAGIPDDVMSPLSRIASPANLPSKRHKDASPKIKIPNIKSSPAKPSPSSLKGFATIVSGIELPATSTIIVPPPVVSPSAINIPKETSSTQVNEEVVQSIKNLDISKLRDDKTSGGYNVSELKVIAGSLGLTKTGNKKDIVARILNHIKKINPSALSE